MSKSKNKQHKTNDEQPAVPTQAQQVQKVPRLPVVSVILPMYNSARYIRSCVESVLNQTFGLFELICVDDCSTDDTVKIVAEMAQKDGRIRVVRLAKNTGGASEPRNTGLRLSRGKYIAFLDSD
ncbi:MAG: glycosyltransferase family 2 protein, partial [Selenomonadaceae bacterium]|nr:glycosyltransferase family 2 protein [Selenomonadaceae bacterium]